MIVLETGVGVVAEAAGSVVAVQAVAGVAVVVVVAFPATLVMVTLHHQVEIWPLNDQDS
jgi:hypothetical protein